MVSYFSAQDSYEKVYLSFAPPCIALYRNGA